MCHRLLLALLIALPLATHAGHLGSVDKMLRKYHHGHYDRMIHVMAQGPHLIGVRV